jgi:hypothetical protein
MFKNKIVAFMVLAFGLCLFISACSSDDGGGSEAINIVSITVNGAALQNNATNIPIDAILEINFSAVLDVARFESEFSISSAAGAVTYNLSFSNGQTKAMLDMNLDYNTTYSINIGTGRIGENGTGLAQAYNRMFTTLEDTKIRSQPPCTNANNCLQQLTLEGSAGDGVFEFYSNYPIYEDNAEWVELTQAIIVVHGASHNANDYFSYLTSTLNTESRSTSTVLVAPFFRNTATSSPMNFYWASTSWRDGQLSSNANKLSSYDVLDKLIERLANKIYFPVLEKIIITGQSSGGRFVHTYAAANHSETLNPDIAFDYVVSESQYFYYPDDRRIDESNDQLYTVNSCTGAAIWPFGYSLLPEYLSNVSASQFNNQFISRSITYLLGNGNGPDGTLNTNNCSATVLGSTRYQRGENMYRYMELVYPGIHRHEKVVANGIAHDGSAIYQSPEFRALLANLLQ